MKKVSLMQVIITSFVFIILSKALYAAPNIVAEIVEVNGREVTLNENGTWQYLSTDRFTKTKAGKRIRLIENGTWQYAGNAALQSNLQVRTKDLDIKLQKTVIESYKKKSQKNTKIKTQTVFHLHLAYSSDAKSSLKIKESDVSLIEVTDNNGDIYPVLSIKPNILDIAPGTGTDITVRVKKSPSIWNNVKTMQLMFNPGFLAIEHAISFSQRVDDFDKKNVDGFE